MRPLESVLATPAARAVLDHYRGDPGFIAYVEEFLKERAHAEIRGFEGLLLAVSRPSIPVDSEELNDALDESRHSDSDSEVSVFERLLCPRKQPLG